MPRGEPYTWNLLRSPCPDQSRFTQYRGASHDDLNQNKGKQQHDGKNSETIYLFIAQRCLELPEIKKKKTERKTLRENKNCGTK